VPQLVFQLAEALRVVLDQRTPEETEHRWVETDLEAVAWAAVEEAWRRDVPGWEPALAEVDALLLRLLSRFPRLAAEGGGDGEHLRTFRIPQLERIQHATAAALVAHRFGIAGLRTVIADLNAPLPRRYFAFFALAERHPVSQWPLFARYLTPMAHHAFVGTAAEAARFYPGTDAVRLLVSLFRAIRGDLHLRAFLGPRILTSLVVLGDRSALPFFREILTAGYTHRVPRNCEVTYALIAVRRFAGALEPNSKYAELGPAATRAVEAAERRLLADVDRLTPVVVI
jgi:hypothetical protein